jgi:protein-S-isoprenylcysteine O-methyltransferase Ste14
VGAATVGAMRVRRVTEEEAGGGSRLLGFVALVALGGVVALVLFRVYPQRVPHDGRPGFVDTIFASTVVVFGARVVLLGLATMLAVGVAFIVASIWMRARAGHWVMTFGPFETRAIDNPDGAAEISHAAWRESQAEIATLRAELAERISGMALLEVMLRAAKEERH